VSRSPPEGYGRPPAAAGPAGHPLAGSPEGIFGKADGIFGKALPGRRRARHAWVFSPSSGPASPRAAASTRSVSVSGVLAATSVLLPRTATHMLSRGSNRMPHRGNLARSFRVSSAGEFSSGIAPSRLPGATPCSQHTDGKPACSWIRHISGGRPAGHRCDKVVIAALVMLATITDPFG
jgi:hypothetical protein